MPIDDWFDTKYRPSPIPTHEKNVGWHQLINADWTEPTRPMEIIEGPIEIPEDAEHVASRTWAQVFKKENSIFRVINLDKLASTKNDFDYAINDARYKVLVAKNDQTNLTPSIYKFDPSNGSIEMELVEGVPLSKIDRNIKIPRSVIERFFTRLREFHELGLFHGDLSDFDHYIITPAGEIRLIDPSFMNNIENTEQHKKIQEIDLAMAEKLLMNFCETTDSDDD